MEDFKRAPWQDQLLRIEPYEVDTPSVHPIDLVIGLSALKKKKKKGYICLECAGTGN